LVMVNLLIKKVPTAFKTRVGRLSKSLGTFVACIISPEDIIG